MEAAVFEGNRKDCAIVSVEIQGLGRSDASPLISSPFSLFLARDAHTTGVDASSAAARI